MELCDLQLVVCCCVFAVTCLQKCVIRLIPAGVYADVMNEHYIQLYMLLDYLCGKVERLREPLKCC